VLGAIAPLVLLAVLTGCGDGASTDELLNTGSDQRGGTSGSAAPDGSTASGTSYAVSPPGKKQPHLSADILVTGEKTLPASLVRKVEHLRYVEAVLPLGLSSTSTNGRTLTVASVPDIGQFRRWAPYESYDADFVWKRVAGGEVAVDNTVSKGLVGKGDMMRLTTRDDIPSVHVGAYAPLVQQATGVGTNKAAIQAVVNAKRGEQLGIPEGNALLVSTGDYTPSKVAKPLKKILGGSATMQTLALELNGVSQTAVLTGESVTDAVGTFSYTSNPDGTVNPDPKWIKEYIRTEQVPIIGTVTCNKGMLPQLIGALSEIQRLGLADKIHPDEYAGCYYPRYINHNPADGLSLHSWGIAVDLNVPGNQRGTAGEMDRGVVAIFKRWGFAWGGDWHYTDPMHFEMDRVVRAGG
jgi:hypothetical protein